MKKYKIEYMEVLNSNIKFYKKYKEMGYKFRLFTLKPESRIEAGMLTEDFSIKDVSSSSDEKINDFFSVAEILSIEIQKNKKTIVAFDEFYKRVGMNIFQEYFPIETVFKSRDSYNSYAEIKKIDEKINYLSKFLLAILK